MSESIQVDSFSPYKAPNFNVESTSGKSVSRESLKGKNVVLYFYPKDSTPGCTTEGLDFSRLLNEFKKHKCEVFGISRDSIKSHKNFCEKQGFKFDLLSDPEEKMCRAFDVIREKSLYGRKYMGVDRSTFLINSEGIVIAEWRSVKVAGHAEEVLGVLKSNSEKT